MDEEATLAADALPTTDIRLMRVLVDGKPIRLHKLARKLGITSKAALNRYRRREQPVTMDAMQADGRKLAGPQRRAGWEKTRDHEKRQQVKELLEGKVPQAEIARLLGVSRQRVFKIKKLLGL